MQWHHKSEWSEIFIYISNSLTLNLSGIRTVENKIKFYRAGAVNAIVLKNQ